MATEVFFNVYESKDPTYTGLMVGYIKSDKQLGMLNFGDDLEFVVIDSGDEHSSQIYKHTIIPAEALVKIDVNAVIANKNLVAHVTPYTPPFRKEMHDGDGTKAEMIVRHVGDSAVQLATLN